MRHQAYCTAIEPAKIRIWHMFLSCIGPTLKKETHGCNKVAMLL